MLISAAFAGAQAAQSPTLGSAQFDVVSIKPNTAGPGAGGGMRTLPDGSFTRTNQPMRSIMLSASPVPVREVSGLPEWVNTDRYDITAKAPPGATRRQENEMLRNMIIERMKLVGHVEEQERTTFALVVARSDGRLGPQLKRSTLDCAPRAPSEGVPPTPPTPPSRDEPQNRCGMSMGRGEIVSGGIAMDQLVSSLTGLAGGLVNNRTGLQGWYALTLRFAPPGLSADPSSVPDDAPQFVTALQEQLGLKLQPEKTRVPIFVVDHIERPTPN
jgi:bla regulator protein BlaR1